MIYLAGSLDLNGGSTFLLRVARENSKAGKIDIVVLSRVIVEEIRAELAQYANIIELAELVDHRFAWCGTNQVSIFLPFNRLKLEQWPCRACDGDIWVDLWVSLGQSVRWR